MIIEKRNPSIIMIDLTGPEGNIYCLLGYAQKFCRLINISYEEVEKEMKSGGYQEAILTFDKYFGSFVTLQI